MRTHTHTHTHTYTWIRLGLREKGHQNGMQPAWVEPRCKERNGHTHTHTARIMKLLVKVVPHSRDMA